MNGTTLHIIASCTDRKRGPVADSCQLRTYPHGRKRVLSWARALGRASCERTIADLYVGNHWAVCRELPVRAAARGWACAKLWAASAGYGLVSSEAKACAYSATFATGHPDSVVDPSASSPTDRQTQAWWNCLTAERRDERTPASVTELATADRDAAILVIASRAYVDAMADDLIAAGSALHHPTRIVIVSTAAPRRPELEAHLVKATANMRGELEGPLTSLHARLGRYLLDRVDPGAWHVVNARRAADRLSARSSVEPLPDRAPMSDREVIAFVRRKLRADSSSSASRLLRELRDGGQACEQKRFKRLFDEARGESCAAARA